MILRMATKRIRDIDNYRQCHGRTMALQWFLNLNARFRFKSDRTFLAQSKRLKMTVVDPKLVFEG